MKKIVRYTNKSSTKERRRELRKNQTKVEKELWLKIRNRQLGVKFRRQYNIDYYIVDFYCHELRLIIELDGYIHGEKANKEKDKKRENSTPPPPPHKKGKKTPPPPPPRGGGGGGGDKVREENQPPTSPPIRG